MWTLGIPNLVGGLNHGLKLVCFREYHPLSSPEDSPRDYGEFFDRTMGSLCADLYTQLMAFSPSLVSANYGLLYMETDDHLPLNDSRFVSSLFIYF